MGHDISSRLIAEEDGFDISEMQRGAYNDQGRYIYQALGVPQYDSGVSGCGAEHRFALEELNQALARLPEDADQEKRFLSETISGCGPDGAIIRFW
jgi:hypothetical protein